MIQPLRRPATWDDLDEVPEGYVGEVVAGEIVLTPRPDPPHTRATSDLGALLGAWFRFGIGGPGGWIIHDEPRIRFGNDIRVPDIGGWKKERYEQPEKGPFLVIPDWVCEVLSMRTAKVDRGEKLPLYARHAVRHCWLLDPIAQTLEIFRRNDGDWLLVAVHTADAKVRAEPFDAVELDLTLVWGPPRPQEDEPE
jgi:Uma2 family endonuclease